MSLPCWILERLQCILQLGLYQQAEDDGTAALQSGPNAKALLRRGTARSLMFKHKDAIQDFQHVLSLEPNNRYARECQGLVHKIQDILILLLYELSNSFKPNIASRTAGFLPLSLCV